MSAAPAHPAAIWPLLVYGAAALLVAAGMLGLSYVLGQRHNEKETGQPYESGAPGTGSPHARFTSRFYLVAVLFVVFDLEGVFIIAMAVSLREVRWTGYLGLLFFLGILAAVLAYAWRLGAFDFALRGKDVLRKSKSLRESGGGR